VKKQAIFDGMLSSCVPYFLKEVEGTYLDDDKCKTCFIKNRVVEMRIKNPQQRTITDGYKEAHC